VASRVRDRVGEARAMGAPLWFGEVGFDHHDPRAAAFENAYVDAMADAGSGWAWWQWRQNGGWGIRNVGGTGIDVAALRRLARPCLLAAPGGVRSRWQPSAGRGALALEVSASHDDEPGGRGLAEPPATGAVGTRHVSGGLGMAAERRPAHAPPPARQGVRHPLDRRAVLIRPGRMSLG
jgi:hypothetical protein